MKLSNSKVGLKKGQMEMVGLVVIVILVTLGMIFAVMFVVKEKPEKKIFTRKGLAYSTVSALMKTTVSGYSLGISGCLELSGTDESLQLGKDILEKCALFNQPSGFETCSGIYSCQFLNETITSLLNATLSRWGKNYEFHAKLITSYGIKPTELFSINPGRCGKKTDRDTSGLFPINTEAGMVESELWICG